MVEQIKDLTLDSLYKSSLIVKWSIIWMVTWILDGNRNTEQFLSIICYQASELQTSKIGNSDISAFQIYAIQIPTTKCNQP